MYHVGRRPQRVANLVMQRTGPCKLYRHATYMFMQHASVMHLSHVHQKRASSISRCQRAHSESPTTCNAHSTPPEMYIVHFET
jgi:hypothetical protein